MAKNHKVLDTKEKIISTTLMLFSQNGYQGTSIREIAKHSGVNIAAVNYHFGNKENLFKQVFLESHLMIDRAVLTEIEKEITSFEDLVAIIYKIYNSYHQMVTAYFRLLVSNSIDAILDCQSEHRPSTAPGFQYVEEWLQNKYRGISNETSIWACRMLMNVVIQQVVISNSQMAKISHHKNELTLKNMQKNIRKLAIALEMAIKEGI